MLGALLLFSCGSAKTSVTGTVHFTPIDLSHASYVPDKNTGHLSIIISTDENPCDPLSNGQQLALTLFGNDSNPQQPGTYSVKPGTDHTVTAGLVVAMGQCPNPTDVTAAEGTVTLTAVGIDTDHPAAGSVDLKFGADSVAGVFSARLCGYDANNIPGLPCR
ncbi:MAG: hypothetical protein QM723_02380 [Myxococcaceae bacterium]